MAIIKGHICKSCGGPLDIDIDRQLYICPFCGVTYDYDYFREDNVMAIAKKAVMRSEFGSAKDAYEFILTKDPHNFEALRGVFLCTLHWKTIGPLWFSEKIHIKEDDPYLVQAIEKCLPEHKGYFTSIQDALKILKEYRKAKSALRRIEDDRTSAEKTYNRLQIARAENQERFSRFVSSITEDMMTSETKIGEFLLYIGIIIIGGIAYATWAWGIWVLLAILGVIIFFTVVYNISKTINDRRLVAEIVPVRAKIESLGDEAKAMRTECEKLIFQYRSKVKEIIANDPLPLKDTDLEEENT